MSVSCNRSVVSSTNKTDCHDITEILLKVALNTINPHNQLCFLIGRNLKIPKTTHIITRYELFFCPSIIQNGWLQHKTLMEKIICNHKQTLVYQKSCPRYSWNTAKVGIKHQSINQPKELCMKFKMATTKGKCWNRMQSVLFTTNVSLITAHVYKICQWLAAGWWFSLGTLVSSINKTDPPT